MGASFCRAEMRCCVLVQCGLSDTTNFEECLVEETTVHPSFFGELHANHSALRGCSFDFRVTGGGGVVDGWKWSCVSPCGTLLDNGIRCGSLRDNADIDQVWVGSTPFEQDFIIFSVDIQPIHGDVTIGITTPGVAALFPGLHERELDQGTAFTYQWELDHGSPIPMYGVDTSGDIQTEGSTSSTEGMSGKFHMGIVTVVVDRTLHNGSTTMFFYYNGMLLEYATQRTRLFPQTGALCAYVMMMCGEDEVLIKEQGQMPDVSCGLLSLEDQSHAQDLPVKHASEEGDCEGDEGGCGDGEDDDDDDWVTEESSDNDEPSASVHHWSDNDDDWSPPPGFTKGEAPPSRAPGDAGPTRSGSVSAIAPVPVCCNSLFCPMLDFSSPLDRTISCNCSVVATFCHWNSMCCNYKFCQPHWNSAARWELEELR